MRNLLIGFLLVVSCATVSAQDSVYEGTWVTTNRQLDGKMTCELTDLGANQWRGHFFGDFQGSKFSYLVNISGPPDNLHGKATIDDADYEWTGQMTGGQL